jgi:hypothetical protein
VFNRGRSQSLTEEPTLDAVAPEPIDFEQSVMPEAKASSLANRLPSVSGVNLGSMTSGLDRSKITIILACLALFYVLPVQIAMSMRSGALKEAEAAQAAQRPLDDQLALINRVEADRLGMQAQARALEIAAPVNPTAKSWISTIVSLAAGSGIQIDTITASGDTTVISPAVEPVEPAAGSDEEEVAAAADFAGEGDAEETDESGGCEVGDGADGDGDEDAEEGDVNGGEKPGFAA